MSEKVQAHLFEEKPKGPAAPLPPEPAGLSLDLRPPGSLEVPFFQSLLSGIKEIFNPPKPPKMDDITSKPVEIKGLEGLYGGNQVKSGLTGMLINCSIVGLVLLLGTMKPVQMAIKSIVPLVAPPPVEKPKIPPKKQIAQGGGGSPNIAPKAPTVARQFMPTPKVPISNPETALYLPFDPNAAVTTTNTTGLPTGIAGLTGLGGGGIGGGIGSGNGNGVGPGSGGGRGGGAFKIGGGVSAPVPTYQPEPEYSEEARKAKWTGTVRIQLVVDENGNPKDIVVTRPLGLGLDEKAIEAVSKWRFKPGTKDGKAVPVQAVIDVAFHLL